VTGKTKNGRSKVDSLSGVLRVVKKGLGYSRQTQSFETVLGCFNFHFNCNFAKANNLVKGRPKSVP
jgi:hypothetical protein